MENPHFSLGSLLAAGALGLLVGCSAESGTDKPPPSTPTLGRPFRIAYFGDSIAAETFSTVGSELQAVSVEVSGSTFPGYAICDFLEGRAAGMPIEKKFKSQVRAIQPDLVILQFWGGALTACIMPNALGTDSYFDQYAVDTLAAVDQIRAASAEAALPNPKILWVLQGPDKAMPERTRRLNSMYESVAAAFGDRTSDAGYDVSMAADPYPNAAHDRYAWTQFLPCSDFERQNGLCTDPAAFGGLTRLHKDGDPVHFCLGSAANWAFSCDTESPGISRYGRHIAADARAWLGL